MGPVSGSSGSPPQSGLYILFLLLLFLRQNNLFLSLSVTDSDSWSNAGRRLTLHSARHKMASERQQCTLRQNYDPEEADTDVQFDCEEEEEIYLPRTITILNKKTQY